MQFGPKYSREHMQEIQLRNVIIKKEIFDKIISSCPLLTTMIFIHCEGLKTINLEKKLHKYLKHFTFINDRAHPADEYSIEIDVPTLETIRIIGSKIWFHILNFSNLKTLSLVEVEIFSNSVEQSHLLCIDAPNILYFDYSGFFAPSISFAPTVSTSTVELHIQDDDDAQSWFLRLSKLLQALRRSKIDLRIFQWTTDNLHIDKDILVHDIINGGNRPVVVDHLEFTIGHLSLFPPVLNGLFCICCPRNITPDWFSQVPNWNKKRELKELGKFFRKIQMMRETGNQEIWQDLEDLIIEGSDESIQKWQRVQVAKKLSVSALSDFDRLRIRLQWSDQDL